MPILHTLKDGTQKIYDYKKHSLSVSERGRELYFAACDAHPHIKKTHIIELALEQFLKEKHE